MGSGVWLKNIISLKKAKKEKLKLLKGSSAPDKANGFREEHQCLEEPADCENVACNGDLVVYSVPIEEIAATRIQTAFRAYRARKNFHRMKGIIRLQALNQSKSVKKQTLTTLSHLLSWNRTQTQIRNRRMLMVTEGLIKQKKLQSQLKLNAKFHDLEVEWSGGSETMEEALNRIQHKEEAALKRERAMAYAFTHQWRANSNTNQGLNLTEMAKTNWGWSWMERWIAARPWESRVLVTSTPKKGEGPPGKTGKNTTKSPVLKKSSSLKSFLHDGKGAKGITKARKLSFGSSDRGPPKQGEIGAGEGNALNVQLVS